MSQKWVIPCLDQEIVHARVVHFKKWVIPCPNQEIIHARLVHLKKWVIPRLEWVVKMGNANYHARIMTFGSYLKFRHYEKDTKF